MFKFLSFICMAIVKVLAHLLYRGEVTWLSREQYEAIPDIKLLVFLNHTSLFEPILIRFAPWRLVWRFSQELVVPGADITLQRPIAGNILRAMMPGCIPITRKNDHSWLHFLSHVNGSVLTAILPEGRMKRRNGLDKFGKPMSVRGGVADILHCLDSGKILFVYSGGLHHVQAPGDKWPKLFKTLKVSLEIVDIANYKAAFEGAKSDGQMASEIFKKQVVADMNRRLSTCPPVSSS
ncbi:MAG: 1-acyl-sn-glycerol-3-phosphate acyltransferase [Aestuariibacter sp.]